MDKIYGHKTYQSRIENLDAFTTTTEIKNFFMVLKRINRSNVHCLKDISNSQIHYRFKSGKQKDCYKTYPIFKDQKKISTQTAIVSTIISLDINMEYYKII
jgi:hypothetical protein